jgi:HSP20 family protein
MSNVSVFTRRDPFAEFDSLVRSAFSPTQGSAARLARRRDRP